VAAIRLLTYPRLFGSVWLERRRFERTLELWWDHLVGQLQLPLCDVCGAPSPRLDLAPDGALRRPNCARAVDSGSPAPQE
jgi:hypothetical protein